MSRRVDRRSVFFLIAAGACALTLLITPSEYRWVGELLIVTYLVLAAASFLDHWSRTRSRPPHT